MSTCAMKKRAPGCLGFIGDDKLPSYVGIVINHYNDPFSKTSTMESLFFLFVAHMSHFWGG